MDNHYPKRIAPTRRYIIKQALLACAASVPGISLSQNSWPVDKRPIKIVVPYTPGGNVDIVARAIQTRMSAILGVPVIVDNKPGASTAIGTIAVARSPADGHTLLAIGNTFVSAYALNRKIGFEPLTEFEALSKTVTLPMVLVVNKEVPVNNTRELLAYLKANPARATNATSGTGSTSHLACAQFESLTGLDIIQVPYKGNSQAMADVVGRQVTMMFDSLGSATQQIDEGLVKAIAVTTLKRSKNFPDLPTLAESGVAGYNDETFNGLVVPTGMPADVKAKLFDAVIKSLADPEVRKRMESLGVDITPSKSPDEFHQTLRDSFIIYEKVAKTIKAT